MREKSHTAFFLVIRYVEAAENRRPPSDSGLPARESQTICFKLFRTLLLTPEKFEQLMSAGIDWITISVDGVGEMYERIRAPAKMEDLLKKLAAYKEIKNQAGRIKPVIKVQTIWPAIKD